MECALVNPVFSHQVAQRLDIAGSERGGHLDGE